MIGISCVVPVYNESDIIADTVCSLSDDLSRDFDDYEIILVNDGSLDDSGAVINEIARQDPHIICIDNDVNLNMGVSVQRGVARAAKEYITYNAADLPFAPSRYMECVSLMEKEHIDCLVIERDLYRGATGWRMLTSGINRLMLKMFFPLLKRGIYDTQYIQIFRREVIGCVMPLSKSPIFTWPEMIFRSRLAGYNVKAIKMPYRPRVIRQGHFGKAHDIIWGMYDMIRFRIRLWNKTI